MDMSKAYDRVEWDFLELVLLRMGFCVDWVTLIMRCVSSIKLNLCLSGEKVGSITPGRGLRQGDPLSPYLFILVAEVLSNMITKNLQSRELRGIKLSNACPELTHSFFADDALLFMNASDRNCLKLAQILNCYCNASGQVANIDKSCVFFSANTPTEVKTRVGELLGIQAAGDPGKYLGIPSIWGKSKHQALSYIRNRVCYKVQGWCKSTLSYAGREVMIKSVINAIPIYPMNCFKFPLKTCRELNTIISNFWWDSSATGGKTHWKAWEQLTRSKSEGGMGFRDFVIMNNALLAKTAWNLMHSQDALWVQVLKSIYFPRSEFIEAKKGSRASWCWSSILEGREFLKNDLFWDLGKGTSIRIWGDNWVPSITFPEKPVDSENFIVNHGKVRDLIRNGVWDLAPVRELLPENVLHAISQIPIPANDIEDKLFWKVAPNGQYSVKLGYKHGKICGDKAVQKASSSCMVSTTDWKSLWKLKTIPRIQQFLWRILSNAVATNEALFHRKRSPTPLCSICYQENESIEHLFFRCSWTRCVWFGCRLGVKLDMCSTANFTSWWQRINDANSGLKDVDITLICWLLWLIWKQRNDRIFNGAQLNPSLVIELATRRNNECLSVNGESSNVTTMPNSENASWCPPSPGFIKINCDGAYQEFSGQSSLGIVCRDDKGNFLWGFVDKIKSISAFMTEALALKRALMLAVDLGNDKVVFETDSKLLQSCVEMQLPDLYDWKSRGIVHDIINLISSEVGFSVSFTPRLGNAAADLLAAEAFKGVCPIGWVLQPSLSLSSILTSDVHEVQWSPAENVMPVTRSGVG